MTFKSSNWRAVLCAAAVMLPAAASAWNLPEGAMVHPPYKGTVPDKSDVVFSTRFKRDNAPDVIRAFGATRVEWVYTDDAAFIETLKGIAPWFGGSVNANGPLPDDDGWARDFDGTPLQPTWMKGWGAKWVTTTHPDTQKVLADQIARQLAMGADSIQVDDALFQYHGALYYGGDFNPSTLAGFRPFLQKYPDQALVRSLGLNAASLDYRDYLKSRHAVKDAADYRKRFRTFPSTPLWLSYIQSTVDENYVRMHRQANASRGKPVPFSMNLLTLLQPSEAEPTYHLARHADYSIPETDIKDMVDVASMAATARALRIGWVPSIRPLTLPENRVAIASLYAMGGQALVPWDTYDGNDAAGKAKRYFGKPQEYADLYRFVRANRGLFDGMESAAVVGIVVPVDKVKPAALKAIVASLTARQIAFAYVPVGGAGQSLKPDRERIRHFKLMVMSNPAGDYGGDVLSEIDATKVPRTDGGRMDAALLDRMQPFLLAPGAQTVDLYARADPDKPGQLFVHVIDKTRGALPAGDSACKRRLGLRKEFTTGLQVVSASWTTPAGSRTLEVETTPQASFVSLDDCPLWGVLKLQFKP